MQTADPCSLLLLPPLFVNVGIVVFTVASYIYPSIRFSIAVVANFSVILIVATAVVRN